MPQYAFDNEWLEARERVRGLEVAFDPGSIRHLEQIGVKLGWRCLEIGGGGGTIANWLCDRVGEAGRVVATDIDPRFLHGLDRNNLEVWIHDVVRDPLPANEYDLIHARFVLEHLPSRGDVVTKLAGSLAPSGWLLVEESDFCSMVPVPTVDPGDAAVFDGVIRALNVVIGRGGFEPESGRRLFGYFRKAGLVDIGAEGRAPLWQGGSAGAEMIRLSIEQIRGQISESGYATTAQIDRVCALLTDPSFAVFSFLTVATWGRRA